MSPLRRPKGVTVAIEQAIARGETDEQIARKLDVTAELAQRGSATRSDREQCERDGDCYESDRHDQQADQNLEPPECKPRGHQ